jgi:ketosteroid isomerase-like protein
MNAVSALSPAEPTADPSAPQLDARDLARTFFDLLCREGPQSALRLVDPEAVVDIVPAGLKGVAAKEGKRFFEELAASFPDLLVQIRSAMGTADRAVLEIKMEGTQAADFLGVLNQEKHLDVDQAWMVWAARGKITGLRAYWCQNQLYRRLAVKRLDRIFILG